METTKFAFDVYYLTSGDAEMVDRNVQREGYDIDYVVQDIRDEYYKYGNGAYAIDHIPDPKKPWHSEPVYRMRGIDL